ncbi:MAG TPA: hypothetical protein VNL94_08410, partial [Candidatus Binatia bacterium]|nr:hypothetical protein [Candidatus Binatia bacterium]
MGRHGLDHLVDHDPVLHDRRHDRPGQLTGRRIGLDLREHALQDGRRGPLAEVGLEHGREGRPAARAQRPDPVGRARLAGHAAPEAATARRGAAPSLPLLAGTGSDPSGRRSFPPATGATDWGSEFGLEHGRLVALSRPG